MPLPFLSATPHVANLSDPDWKLHQGKQFISIFSQEEILFRQDLEAFEDISKMLGRQSPAVSICSPSLLTVHLACLSPSLGNNQGWTVGCREQAERQGWHRVVTSSDPAGQPWAEWAMTSQRPKAPEQGPLCPTTSSTTHLCPSVGLLEMEG